MKVDPLTLAELANKGDSTNQVEFARWTHRNLSSRIGRRLHDFLFLPYKVMANPSINYVHQRYVDAYMMHEDMNDINSLEAATEYWQALANTLNNNKDITSVLGMGRNQLIRLDPAIAPTLDSFLDRFFRSRAGTHLAASAFLQSGPAPPRARKPAGVAMGVVQPTNIAATVRVLGESLASSGPECACPLDVQGAPDAWIEFVPGHVQVILRSILRNAMSASVLHAQTSGTDVEPVRVNVNHGRFGVFVTITDRGGGIENFDRIWSWGPTAWTQEELERDLSDEELEWADLDESDDSQPLPMVPIGFGAPLARLVARYFGGDVQLRSLLGHGTTAYIHIPELQQDMSSLSET